MALRRMVRGGRFRVAPGSQDIRGWRLLDAEGRPAGVVGDLLFDEEDLRVRSAVVDLGDKRVLVPIALIDARREAREAVIRGYERSSLLALEPYDESAYEPDDVPAGGLWSLFASRRAGDRTGRAS